MTFRRSTLLVAFAAAVAVPALAQPPAATSTIPQVCTNCHQAKPDAVQGLFENVAFKSQAMQLKIDAHTQIVRFDPKTIKVVDAGTRKPAEALRDIPKQCRKLYDPIQPLIMKTGKLNILQADNNV